MSAPRDLPTFRHELADQVITELSPDYARVSPYFGERYADSNAAEAQALRRSNGTFEWVAFGFDPYSMWDAHVGVLTADAEVTAGFHVHERLSAIPPAAAKLVADEFDAEYRFSEAAAEHQFNRSPVSLNAVDVDTLAGGVAEMCRRFEPVVDELTTSSR